MYVFNFLNATLKTRLVIVIIAAVSIRIDIPYKRRIRVYNPVYAILLFIFPYYFIFKNFFKFFYRALNY